MNCTAEVRADGCDVWVPTQGQTASHQAAIAASGLPADKVKIHTTYLGGGFGRRGEADFVTEAVETSKAVGKPVKVVWSREDDMQHDYYRPVTYVRMWGALDAAGKPVAFMQRIVQQSLMKRIGALPPNGVDFISVDGSPSCRTQSRTSGSNTSRPILASRSASGGRSAPPSRAIVVEAFIDEMATMAGRIRTSSVATCWARRRAIWRCSTWSPKRQAGPRRRRGTCARHRRDGVLRQHRRTGGGSVGDQRRGARSQDLVRGRYRLGDRSRYDQGADGRRHDLRADGGAERRDHDPERPRRAASFRRTIR